MLKTIPSHQVSKPDDLDSIPNNRALLCECRSCAKCGFLLAEEQKKQKTFFSHTAVVLGIGLQGVSGHMAL